MANGASHVARNDSGDSSIGMSSHVSVSDIHAMTAWVAPKGSAISRPTATGWSRTRLEAFPSCARGSISYIIEKSITATNVSAKGAHTPRQSVRKIRQSQPCEVHAVTLVPATTEPGPQSTFRGRMRLAPQNASARNARVLGRRRRESLVDGPASRLGPREKRKSSPPVTNIAPAMAQTVYSAGTNDPMVVTIATGGQNGQRGWLDGHLRKIVVQTCFLSARWILLCPSSPSSRWSTITRGEGDGE
mmetsp:Transcript_4000/g.11478  ORF Transcript_4000/g.11478 Transcript_4000/m.11478 type:complete len:246 (-) Transcript_4000:42-779(-)